jgi:hypothetical protein
MAEVAAIAHGGPTAPPPAPQGFHYRGDAPTYHDGKMSKLCTFVENEETKTKKEKYEHMFVRLDDHVSGVPQLLCACNKIVKVAFYKGKHSTTCNDIDYGNLFSHMESTHPFELTAKDQAPKKGTVEKEKKGLCNPSMCKPCQAIT